MRFANPQLLWLLLLVPILIVGIALRYGWRRRLINKLGDSGRIGALVASVSPGRRVTKAILFVAGVAILIIALARPQAGERSTLAPTVGIDIVVALDFSKSMLARDAYPSRIERAKAELGRMLDQLKGDRVGLVAFAGETLSYPLTTDYTAAKMFWRNMTPMDLPVGGTAIGKAIVAATRLLAGVRGKGPERSQVIVLLTDGEDHESDPVEAAKQAAKLGIRIYTVGIGSRSGEPVPEVSEDGTILGYLKQSGGTPVTSRLDAQTLQTIAAETEGAYIEMSPKSFAVEPVLTALDKLQKSEVKERLIKHYDEVHQWFIGPALLLLLIEGLIGTRRRRKHGEVVA